MVNTVYSFFEEKNLIVYPQNMQVIYQNINFARFDSAE